MLRTTRRAALGSLLTIALLASALGSSGAGPTDARDALAARAGTAALVGETVPVPASVPAPHLAACTGSIQQCFEPGAAAEYVNVGAFFDRRRRTLADDYMIKLFQPDAPGTYDLTGFSFICNRGGLTFPGAGAVVTPSASPNFPTVEQLASLQQVNFTLAPSGQSTCIDLGSSVTLEPGDAAWLIVHLSQDTAFVGLSAERDPTDHPCDFLSRDGELWYRPDPLQTRFDWLFVANYVALPARRASVLVPWSFVKRNYR